MGYDIGYDIVHIDVESLELQENIMIVHVATNLL